jgi:hypothetical protein
VKIISDQFKLEGHKSDDVIDVNTVARNAFVRAEAEGLFDREMELYCLMLVGWEPALKFFGVPSRSHYALGLRVKTNVNE